MRVFCKWGQYSIPTTKAVVEEGEGKREGEGSEEEGEEVEEGSEEEEEGEEGEGEEGSAMVQRTFKTSNRKPKSQITFLFWLCL